MDYERIHKVESGVISPSKLRMKLMGPHHRKKEGSSSNCSSSRTSPSRVGDTEFVKSSLLDCNDDHDVDFADEVGAPSSGLTSTTVTSEAALDPDTDRHHPSKENTHELDHVKIHQLLRSESVNSNTVHTLRAMEDENPGYDSSSSFEFHKERSAAQSQLARSLSRPMAMSSKWNDAEKWIINKQNVQQQQQQQHGGGYPKKNGFHGNQGGNRVPVATHMGRVAPELVASGGGGRMVDTKRVDFCQTASQIGLEKFSFLAAPGTPSISGQGNMLMDQYGESKDLKEVDTRALSAIKTSTEDRTVVPVIRSVCMRDMGTEMTPMASQEPSRTGTPVGATTPIRSPTSSMPSTPRGGPTTTPAEHEDGSSNKCTPNQNVTKRELTEEELKLKTRREIVALGVKLGKMNIAAWASKDEEEKNMAQSRDMESVEQIEFEKRAAAWEEAEKCKHTARYKREEIQIQAWESQQIAKLEAEMRRTEAKVEQMKAQAEARMVKKVAMARQRAEERRAAAESRKNRDAERTAGKAEYIRQIGRMPPTHYLCCGWW